AAVTLAFLAHWGPAQPANGSDATSAARTPASVATVTAVSAASDPRRTYPSASAACKRGETADDVTRPTSTPSRNTFAPFGTGTAESIFRPRNDQFTCPRSRAR